MHRVGVRLRILPLNATQWQYCSMDSIDRAIIGHLQRNARLSNNELADRVGLTPSPCLRRVRRLEEEGVILGYHARIDPDAINQGFEVWIEVELADMQQATVEQFEAALISYDEISEARRMFGSPDYEALVRVADRAAYEAFMTQQLTALPGLGRMQSRFPMKTIKSQHQ